ncbi:MAG: hypothetical protein ACD_2C00130G0005 [uncultured bacterium (gcode 4)]|uniref:phospholipase D n=1 Tax=uncultured bacterium (gcode 4) TaxID=1234023 RepID=K2GGY3_9BACT|nr:MAG: hypothetical protein ACD_2C00130G0005 [uncultured bacterium (gcode 4)]
MKKLSVLLIALLLLLNSCSNEYIEYHSAQLYGHNSEKTVSKNDFFFNVENVQYREFEMSMTPDKKLLDVLISKIDNAKKRIYLEVYILTEKRIIKALKDAKSRWLDVKVILEKNVYWAWNINRKSSDTLTSSWVSVTFANNWNYRFTHTKLFLIDDEYVISTWNMSFSTFSTNMEIMLFGKDKKDLSILEEVIDKDIDWEKFVKCDDSLGISPSCPRSQFMNSLTSAKKSIYIYAETFDDPAIEALLIQKDKEWVDVRVLLGDVKKIKSNSAPLTRLKSSWINIIAPKKPYIHAKVFIIDWKFAYVWSINFSTNSIENNREIWIIFKNDSIIGKLQNEFLTNFSNKQ